MSQSKDTWEIVYNELMKVRKENKELRILFFENKELSYLLFEILQNQYKRLDLNFRKRICKALKVDDILLAQILG